MVGLRLQHHGCFLFFFFLPLLTMGDQEYKNYKVHYVTDRTSLLEEEILESNTTFETGSLEALKYGTVEVGMPMLTTKKLDAATPSERVVIYSLDNMGNNYTQLIQNINSEFSISSDIFIFVHGYRATFKYALQKLTQLKHDLKFLGPVITYSWDSKGTISAYFRDGRTVEKTIPYFKNFIKLCMSQLKGKRIHILAHSMGNRALIGALEMMYTESNSKEWLRKGMLLKSVIFAGGDENMERFEGMFRVLKGVHEAEGMADEDKAHLTIYTATDDKTLFISRVLNNGPRLGLTDSHFGEMATTLKEDPQTGYVSVIDATNLGYTDSFLNHFYYSNNLRCIHDIQTLLSSPPPLHRAYYRALDSNSTISMATYANTYHFTSFSPSFWTSDLILGNDAS